MQPAISIIIPVHNREGEIGRCLSSLLNQDFPDFEAIVINDGSTDQTSAVVASFADPRIRLINQSQKGGQCAARNAGIRAASSPLLSFLDSDDEFLPGKLGFVHDYFTKQPDSDVLIDSFACSFPTAKGSVMRVHRNPELRLSSEIEDAVYSRKLWKATGAISARRDALIQAGLWDESLQRREDMDLVLRLARSSRCASTAAVLWIKHNSVKALSADRQTFISALIDIVRRHPAYTSRHRWRAGLAMDMSTHLAALLINAQLALALRDWQQLRQFFGVQGTLYYLALGSVLFLVRILRHSAPA